MEISTIYQSANILGESPFWHSERESIFWVDIERCTVNEYNAANETFQFWNIAKRVSVILKAVESKLIIGVQGGIMELELNNGTTQMLIPVDADHTNHRCNDGAIDRKGRIWVGTMDVDGEDKAGGLFKIDNQHAIKMLANVTIPNGIVWSADHKLMYFTDTLNRTVKAYNFNEEKGNIQFLKDAVIIPEKMGMPDGLTIDQEGMLWTALYGGAGIARWNPSTGEKLRYVELPALNITNCCFVNGGFTDMAVTSATENMSEKQLSEYPESGNLFLIKNIG